MTEASPTPPFATAADRRHHLGRAADLLATAPGRADIDWDDLLQVAAWAFDERADIEGLAWATGAWLHADELRRCIDGRALALLRTRLGVPALQALMDAPPSAFTPTRDGAHVPLCRLSASALDDRLCSTGREWLLASVERATLRTRLRLTWWPDSREGPGHTARQRMVARAVVGTALAHRDRGANASGTTA